MAKGPDAKGIGSNSSTCLKLVQVSAHSSTVWIMNCSCGQCGNIRSASGCCCTSKDGSRRRCNWRMELACQGIRARRKAESSVFCWQIYSFTMRSTGGCSAATRTSRSSGYADDVIVHCKSEYAAKQVLREIDQRMAECGLVLHPDKTKVVYCKDGQRRRNYSETHFDFLGYRFQPRCAQCRGGELFLSFLPAVSVKAGKSIQQTIRSWKTHRWTQLKLKELAISFNPVLRGWINYYGKFYKSKLAPILGQFDYALVRWVKRKYKRLGGSPTRARAWLMRVVAQQPGLFAHWHITYAGMTER